MKQSDILYIKSYLSTYYVRTFDKIYNLVKEPEKREWAVLNIDDRMIRHINISNLEDFRSTVSNYTPKGLYHSASYYESPGEEMDQKYRLSTDIIFDLDADHIPRVDVVKIYKCTNISCGEYGEKEKCRICGSEAKKIIFVDDDTINPVVKELKKLLSVLQESLGVNESSTRIFFSGLRGFHIHIEEGPLLELGDIERINLKDFFTLDGLDLSSIRDKNAYLVIKLVDEAQKLLETVNNQELKTFLMEIDKLKDDRKELYRLLKDFGKDKELLKKFNDFISSELGIGIDPAVLTDLSRLIRAPLSIHGKSGLIKLPITNDALDKISVIKEAMPTNVKCKVYVYYLPRIKWGGEEYGPFYNETIVLPEPLAVYIVNLRIGESLSIP